MLGYMVLSILLLYTVHSNADVPCQARKFSSVVCVCNQTFCDTITRTKPKYGTYVAYTSSEEGLRFHKHNGTFQTNKTLEKCSSRILVIQPGVKYQTIEGFGGAVTDAAGINWKNLTPALQKYLVDSYFSDNGLEYNMIRVPIGGSDFSTHPYAYNELPENDAQLSNFTLSYEDYQYKIPLIKLALQAAKSPVHLVATTWSPPAWMKTNNQIYGRSRLKAQYYQTYADYHLKFIEKYAAENIPIWAITTTNEPTSGLLGLDNFNTLGWTQSQMANWITSNLGPTIRNSTFSNVKIITVDDQRLTIPYWFNLMVTSHPEALKYIDGIGVHYYSDFVTPASILSEVSRNYPGIFILATEASQGSYPWETEKVMLGSWQRAESYIRDIIEDLNHNVVGWVDWNLCLNAKGGPNWDKNFVDSPIIVFPERSEFVKQPMFYGIGHFSKFVPRGSVRLGVREFKGFFAKSVDHVAFLTPGGTIVAVLYNRGKTTEVTIKIGRRHAVLKLESKSVTTVEFPFKTSKPAVNKKKDKIKHENVN